MKKTIFFSLLLASTALFSCKKNKTDEPTPATIVGKWKHDKDVVKRVESNGTVSNTTTVDYTNSNTFWQFKADGTGVIHQEFPPSSGVYTDEAMTYKLEGTKLSLTIRQGSDERKVETLTATKLILSADMPHTNPGSSTVLYTDRIEEHFTRQ